VTSRSDLFWGLIIGLVGNLLVSTAFALIEHPEWSLYLNPLYISSWIAFVGFCILLLFRKNKCKDGETEKVEKAKKKIEEEQPLDGSLDKETLREYLFEEAEIIQDIISRMANNSFWIKGWSVTLIVASLLFKGVFPHHLVALVPWFFFWWYDAYFLRLEKLYRALYDWLIKNRLDSNEFLLDVNKDSLEKRFGNNIPTHFQIMFSKTLVFFYLLLLILIISAILIDYTIIH